MQMQIREILVDGRREEPFTDSKHPQFAVFTEGKRPAIIRLILKDTCGRLCWEKENSSKTVPGEGVHFFSYDGIPLQARSSYSVRAEAIWDDGTMDSAETSFHTGFFGGPWEAKWIEPMQENTRPEADIPFFKIFDPHSWTDDCEKRLLPAQEIRRTFSMDIFPEEAVLYATAHGVYDVKLNGMRVGESWLAPEISEYPRRLYYQRYDVTRLLRKGENALCFTVADGWWSGRIGLIGASCQYGDRLGLLAQLEIAFPGGERKIIASDERFACRPSQVRYADLYVGEKQDLTYIPEQWRSCRFSRQQEMHQLIAQPLDPVRELARIDGKLLRDTDGELLIDFQSVLAGVVSLQVSAEGKRKIVLEHCEVLDEKGRFHHNIMGRNKQQRDTFICDRWPAVLQPRFTYHGFRYVRVRGLAPEEILSAQAVVLGSPIPLYGTFSSSDQRLDRFWKNIAASMRGNFLSIPTDCPQREKMGWTGDMQIFAGTAAYLGETSGFLRAWLANMRLEQRPDGEIPNYVPAFPINDKAQRKMSRDGSNCSAGWGDACVLVPLALYRMNGDRSILLENLPMMERWLRYIEERCETGAASSENPDTAESGRKRFLWEGGNHFGDWLIPSLDGRPDGIPEGKKRTAKVMGSMFHALTLRSFLEVLEILRSGEADAGKCSAYRALSDRSRSRMRQVRTAVRDAYIREDGSIRGDMQGEYVLALYAGILEDAPALRQKVADRLTRKIHENGDRLDTGFISTPYLLQVLCDNGQEALAWELMRSEEPPSWLYQVAHGATTVWESWTSVKPDGSVAATSLNHYSFGSVGSWMVERIAGIRKIDVDRGRVLFVPDLAAPLTFASAGTRVPSGEICCGWRREGMKLTVDIRTPLEAEIVVGDRSRKVEAGEHHLEFALPESTRRRH